MAQAVDADIAKATVLAWRRFVTICQPEIWFPVKRGGLQANRQFAHRGGSAAKRPSAARYGGLLHERMEPYGELRIWFLC